MAKLEDATLVHAQFPALHVTPTTCCYVNFDVYYYGRTLSDASMLYFADVFFIFFFMPALVGQTAERIFTKLSHVVDIRCYLRTY